MTARAQISITLPLDQLEAIEAAVAAGDFASTSDVVSAAVDVLLAERAFADANVDELRRLWAEGKASGDASDFSFDELRRSARRALAERR